MMVRRFLALISLTAMGGLSACSPSNGTAESQDSALEAEEGSDPTCDPLGARATPLELFVEPDAASGPFTAAIERATHSIDVLIYEMGFGPVLDALAAKARAGVAVRIILDVAQKRVNQRYMDLLIAAGANAIWSDPGFTFMHAKIIVVDGVEAMVSTGNFGATMMARERNYVVRDTDPDDVAVLGRLFDADFARTTPDLACTRLLVSPLNARERLLAFLRSAQRTILVESMQLADRDVQSVLAERKAAGVEVRALLAAPSWIDANTAAAAFLASNGIPARWRENPNLHVKAVVVDGQAAYVGSINLSYTSLTKNREVGLLVGEPSNVATVTSTFEADWSDATPF